MARRLSSPVFIGRSFELSTLLSMADAAASGQPSLALVGGEAGVGKSRLVAEVARRLGERGWLVLEGASVALGDDGLPFGPIVEALRGLVDAVDPARIRAAAGPTLPELVRLVPELSVVATEAPIRTEPAEWLQTRTFGGIRRLLGRLGETAPVLFVIEDLHWADRSTRDLLSFLGRNASDERLLVVGTFRSDALHRRHPLTSWLAEIERQPGSERLNLERLDRVALVEMMTAITGRVPPTPFVDSIERRSDGNAFFAEELIAAADNGDVGQGRLPETLREVLSVRLSATSESARRIVEIAAVAGRQVDHDILSDVCGSSVVELTTALHEAVDAQILVAEHNKDVERYQFRHALVQEAAYDELLPAERRGLHAAYARAIEVRPAGGGVAGASRLVELSHHWRAALEPARTLPAAIAAGDASIAVYAYAEAARQYERAIEVWDVVPIPDRPSDRDLADLYLDASTAAIAVGDATLAVNLARRATELIDATARPDGDRERQASARGRLATASALAGDATTSLRLLRESVELLEGSPPSEGQASALADLASALAVELRSEEAFTFAERAIEVARAIGHGGSEARAMRTMGIVLNDRGHVADGIDLLRRSLALALASPEDDPAAMLQGYNTLSAVLENSGFVEEALEVSLAALQSVERYGGDLSYRRWLVDNTAEILIQLGRYADAGALLDRHLARVRPGRAIHIHFTRAHLAVRTGDLPAARRHLEIARSEMGSSPDLHMLLDLHVFGTELELWGGDPAAALAVARALFDRAAETVQDRDVVVLPASLAFPAMHAAADLAVRARAGRDSAGVDLALNAAREVMERYRTSTGRMTDPDAIANRETAWRIALCEAEMARAAGDDDPARWDGVRESVASRPAPFLEAYVLWRKAEALGGRGGSKAAGKPLLEAHAIAVAIGAGPLVDRIEATGRAMRIDLSPPALEPTPAAKPVPTADADPFALSKREREVLPLVAQGYTNRRIAEALFISESTAGVHVSNILGKLGVESRTEAAAIAVRLGLDRTP